MVIGKLLTRTWQNILKHEELGIFCTIELSHKYIGAIVLQSQLDSVETLHIRILPRIYPTQFLSLPTFPTHPTLLNKQES